MFEFWRRYRLHDPRQLHEWLRKSKIWWLVCFASFNIESSISYNSRLWTWWLTTNWMTVSSEFESLLFSIFLLSYTCWNRWVAREKEMIKSEMRRIIFSHWRNNRDRSECIKFRKSFEFSIFSFHIHNNQRSVKSSSSLWNCFWHDSVFHAS